MIYEINFEASLHSNCSYLHIASIWIGHMLFIYAIINSDWESIAISYNIVLLNIIVYTFGITGFKCVETSWYFRQFIINLTPILCIQLFFYLLRIELILLFFHRYINEYIINLWSINVVHILEQSYLHNFHRTDC